MEIEAETGAVTDGLGPMQRWEIALRDGGLAERVMQRVAGGETLNEIRRSMGLPKIKFLTWVASNGELSAACLRVRELAGIELRMEGLEIVDGEPPRQAVGPQGEPLVDDAGKPVLAERDVARDKLRSDYREKLSRDLNRPLFGKFTQHEHRHTVDLGERLRRARERTVEAGDAAQIEDAVLVQAPAAHEMI